MAANKKRDKALLDALDGCISQGLDVPVVVREMAKEGFKIDAKRVHNRRYALRKIAERDAADKQASVFKKPKPDIKVEKKVKLKHQPKFGNAKLSKLSTGEVWKVEVESEEPLEQEVARLRSENAQLLDEKRKLRGVISILLS
jgi:hypothetical protein